DSAPRRRLAEGRPCARAYRHDRRTRHRSRRRAGRSLASRPSLFRHRHRAARIHPRAPRRMAQAPERCAMSRAAVMLAMLVSCALVAEPTWRDGGPAFIWNASPSVPIGLYRLAPVSHIEVPDLVVVEPPEPLAGFLAERGYLPRGVPLLKRVLAVAGDTVCRQGTTIVAFDHAYG